MADIYETINTTSIINTFIRLSSFRSAALMNAGENKTDWTRLATTRMQTSILEMQWVKSRSFNAKFCK